MPSSRTFYLLLGNNAERDDAVSVLQPYRKRWGTIGMTVVPHCFFEPWLEQDVFPEHRSRITGRESGAGGPAGRKTSGAATVEPAFPPSSAVHSAVPTFLDNSHHGALPHPHRPVPALPPRSVVPAPQLDTRLPYPLGIAIHCLQDAVPPGVGHTFFQVGLSFARGPVHSEGRNAANNLRQLLRDLPIGVNVSAVDRPAIAFSTKGARDEASKILVKKRATDSRWAGVLFDHTGVNTWRWEHMEARYLAQCDGPKWADREEEEQYLGTRVGPVQHGPQTSGRYASQSSRPPGPFRPDARSESPIGWDPRGRRVSSNPHFS